MSMQLYNAVPTGADGGGIEFHSHAVARSVCGRVQKNRAILRTAACPAHHFVVVHLRDLRIPCGHFAVLVELLAPARSNASHSRSRINRHRLAL